jgi:hypothetical protein
LCRRTLAAFLPFLFPDGRVEGGEELEYLLADIVNFQMISLSDFSLTS